MELSTEDERKFAGCLLALGLAVLAVIAQIAALIMMSRPHGCGEGNGFQVAGGIASIVSTVVVGTAALSALLGVYRARRSGGILLGVLAGLAVGLVWGFGALILDGVASFGSDHCGL
jgi:hypothetical protein